MKERGKETKNRVRKRERRKKEDTETERERESVCVLEGESEREFRFSIMFRDIYFIDAPNCIKFVDAENIYSQIWILS
jgi:hypothetical protein